MTFPAALTPCSRRPINSEMTGIQSSSCHYVNRPYYETLGNPPPLPLTIPSDPLSPIILPACLNSTVLPPIGQDSLAEPLQI